MSSATQVNLTWTDNSNNETDFVIERKTGSGGSWIEIDTTAATVASFTDYDVIGGTQYYYRVKAVHEGASSAFSTEVNVTTLPASPTGLTLTGSTSGILLDWADNTEPTLSGYNVYRASSPDG